MTCPGHLNEPERCGSLIQCPYNKDHYSDPKSFAEHLRDCRREYCSKNASSIKMVRCALNSRHHVPQIEIDFHEQICQNYYFQPILTALKRLPNPLPDYSSEEESSLEDSLSSNDSSSDTDTSSEYGGPSRPTSSSSSNSYNERDNNNV